MRNRYRIPGKNPQNRSCLNYSTNKLLNAQKKKHGTYYTSCYQKSIDLQYTFKAIHNILYIN